MTKDRLEIRGAPVGNHGPPLGLSLPKKWNPARACPGPAAWPVRQRQRLLRHLRGAGRGLCGLRRRVEERELHRGRAGMLRRDFFPKASRRVLPCGALGQVT